MISVECFEQGIVYCDYVAEIILHPWEASNPLDAAMVTTKTKIHPVHESEDGKIYLRKNASIQTVSSAFSPGLVIWPWQYNRNV